MKADQILAWLDSPQQEAIRDTQKARIVSDQRRLEQLQRQLPTYEEKIKQAQIYENQAEIDAPAQVAAGRGRSGGEPSADLVRWEAELRADPGRCGTICPPGEYRRGGGPSGRPVPDQGEDRRGIQSRPAASRSRLPRQSSAAGTGATATTPRIKAADRLTLLRQVDEVKAQIASAEADVEADKAALRKIEADLERPDDPRTHRWHDSDALGRARPCDPARPDDSHDGGFDQALFARIRSRRRRRQGEGGPAGDRSFWIPIPRKPSPPK